MRSWLKSMSPLMAVLVLSCDDSASKQSGGFNDSKRKTKAGVITVKGLATHECGKIPEGPQYRCVFEYENTASHFIELSARGSCSVKGMAFDPVRVMPGRIGRIYITINTLGRGGDLNEVVDLFMESERVGSLWITGTVESRLLLYLDPPFIDLGTVERGQVIQRHIGVTGRGTDDFQCSTIKLHPSAMSWGDCTLKVDKMSTESALYKGKERRHLWHFSSTLSFGRLSTGRFRQAVEVVALDAQGMPLASIHIPVCGNVVGRIASCPEVLFLGQLKVGENRQCSIALKHDKECSKGLNIKPSGQAIAVLGMQPQSDGIVATMRIVAQHSGLLRESILISNDLGDTLEVPLCAVVMP